MRDTWPLLDKIPFPALTRRAIDTLQVNLGYRCNQSCVHCHVAAGPNRTEQMGLRFFDLGRVGGNRLVLNYESIRVVDIGISELEAAWAGGLPKLLS